MTPATLAAFGRALYGPHWQSPLSRDLGVNDRTMRRWAAGDSAMPLGVLADLKALLLNRMAELKALLRS